MSEPASPVAHLPPPEPPLPGDCCGNGCAECVYVVYERELEQWSLARQAAAGGNS